MQGRAESDAEAFNAEAERMKADHGITLAAYDGMRTENTKLAADLKLAQKDAADWALNHENEKRRADGNEAASFWAALVALAGVCGMAIFGVLWAMKP